MIVEPPEHRSSLATGPGVGSSVAGYRLEKQIGAGGMAVVYRAMDERLGRPVALKIMAPAIAADETFRLRFIRESRAAAAVDDPYIIPVYEAGEADGVLFIAIRFVNGGDVGTLLHREGPLPAARVVSIISPVASALDAAHAAGLVHRDVKPSNMLLDTRPGRPDHVYLSDFGISKSMQSGGLTGSGHFLGTPDYTSPEQIQGLTVDGRTDQYALACAAFELLTGRAPFAPSEGWATVWAHLNKQPPALTSHRPDVSPAMDQIFARAMAKRPQDRFASCRQFADALREALAPAAGVAAPAYRTADTAPPTRMSRVATVAGPAAPPMSARRGGGGRRIRPARRRRLLPTVLAVIVILAGADFALHVLSPSLNLHRLGSPRPALFVQVRAFTAPRPAGASPYVSAVAFSPDGTTLATGLSTETPDSPDHSGTTSLWNVATGKRLATLASSGGAEAFRPGGKMLAAVGGFGNSHTSLWNPATGKKIAILDDRQQTSVEAVAFSPDGKMLAANDEDGVVYLWAVANRRVLRILGGPGTSITTALAFSPDDSTLATGENGDRAFLWNLATGRHTGTLKGAGDALMTSVAFSPDGTMVAGSDQNGRTYLWDTSTSRRIATLTDPHSYGVEAVAFSPDARMLATGDSNGRTFVWNLPAMTLAGTLTNPAGPVTSLLTGQSRTAVFSVAFSPDGTTLATSDTNGNAYLWRVR